MTIFVFPDGTSIGLDQDLCDEYEAESDHEGLVAMVSDVLADWGFDGVPLWWKDRYKHAIIDAAIWDGHTMMTGIVCNERFNEWYASPEVPYGHVEFR